jgi:glycosyltransferase involved in cell wall biosynthesis
MKIVHLSSVHASDDQRICKICRSAVSADRAVSFVVPTDQECIVDGVAIKAVPIPSSRFQRILSTTWRVYQRAVKEQGDIYQFHDPELIPVGLALQLLHKHKVIYDIHENVPEQILGKTYIPSWLRKPIAAIEDVIERQSAKRFSAIVTANEDISERFSEFCDHVVAIHNYAEVGEFCYSPEADDSRYSSGLIFLSAASDRTSFPAVLRAIELVSKNVPTKLIATGSSVSESASAADVVERLGCQHIEVLGMLSRRDMARQLLQSVVSVVLYRDDRNHSSIRSNRFFESLASATPVIVSDFPEWRAAVESIGCGLAVDPADPRAIASALEYFLTNPDQAAAMGKSGRRAFLKTFSWTQEKSRLLQLYDSLLCMNPAAPKSLATPI